MIQVAVLEEQKNEAAEDEVVEKVEDESNPIEADSSAAKPTSKNETLDEKPDINDVPMEESEVNPACLFIYFMFIYIPIP